VNQSTRDVICLYLHSHRLAPLNFLNRGRIFVDP
jgi:hypothetical protein